MLTPSSLKISARSSIVLGLIVVAFPLLLLLVDVFRGAVDDDDEGAEPWDVPSFRCIDRTVPVSSLI